VIGSVRRLLIMCKTVKLKECSLLAPRKSFDILALYKSDYYYYYYYMLTGLRLQLLPFCTTVEHISRECLSSSQKCQLQR